MNSFWSSIIRPILEEVHAKYIVEIGSDTGLNTKNILDYCLDHNAKMTAIDPAPKFDTEQFKAEYGEKFNIYEELSLSRLPILQDFDVILIDGDHNWYTVYNELKIIEKKFKNKKFPIIFLHDISWPYARRDLYYNPENIPETYRQPYKKLGLQPGQKNLLKTGGLNPELNNSIYENNPHNGVLTAIEEFIEQSNQEFQFKKINAFFGLGILYPKNIETNKIIEKTLKNANIMEKIEEERIKQILSHNNTKNTNNTLQTELTKTQTKLEKIENKTNQEKIEKTIIINELKNQQTKTQTELKQTKTELKQIKTELKQTKHLTEQTNQQNKKLKTQINKITTNLYQIEYQNNKNRSITQRLTSKLYPIYILLNKNNTSLKNAITNIKGYKKIKQNQELDIGYYLKNNPDVRKSGKDPILHYIYQGYKENRNPNPTFNTKNYQNQNKDVKKSKINPLIHYTLHGKKENRKMDHAITPKVSIITASYNYANIIEKGINSVINQTYKNWELIIVDDGSTDDSLKIIRKYSKNPKIKIFQHEGNVNKGLKDTIILGLKQSTGEYIAFLEADDWLENNYLEEKIGVLTKYPNINFIFNDVTMFSDDNFDLSWYNNYLESQKKILKNQKMPFDCTKYLIKHNFIPTFSCVLVKKDMLLSCNFDTPSDPTLDFWLFKQLASKTKFYFINKKLTHWMMHKESYIHDIFNPKGDFDGFE
jgi:hypothetical protein